MKHIYRTTSLRTELLASQLQVPVELVVWDQKPEVLLQVLLLIC